MGLDVYVGPMTRYHAGEWQTIVQQMGAAEGVEVRVVRMRGASNAVTDLEEILQRTVEWRDALSSSALAAGQIKTPLDWVESTDGPYWTDKPDWSGLHALQLLALHDEFPDLPLPTRFGPREDPGKQPLYQRFEWIYQGKVRVSLGDRLLGRKTSPPPTGNRRYPNLLLPEMWLPVDMAILEAEDGPGKRLVMGSLPGLLGELEGLNARALKANDETIASWRSDGPPEDDDFGQLARFGFATFLELARTARDQHLPMRLDY